MSPPERAPSGREPILEAIRRIRRPAFTTREAAALSSKSLSSASQALGRLAARGILVKLKRGLWADTGSERLSAAAVVPYLIPGRAYISFLSALHYHGLIEQIPQTITVASTGHSRNIRTQLGSFRFHRIVPAFFGGFERAGERAGGGDAGKTGWTGKAGGSSVLMATPEKALVDCLYLSAHRSRQYGKFPELHFDGGFSFDRAREWAERVPSARVRSHVLSELEKIRKGVRS